jgi:tRNA A-37 threonylcarbamoyl transferase component Bud32
MTDLLVPALSDTSFDDIVRGPYVISSRGIISDEQATALIRALRQGGGEIDRSTLGGRSKSAVIDLPGLGRVFVKHYSHGGLLRAVTAGRFLGLGPVRSRVEFEMLNRVRGYGVNAPEPYAIVKKGSVVYGTWLVMEELRGARNLVELQRTEGDELHRVMTALGEQLVVLIQKRILHIDLHPGNVLVSPDGKVYIVDFDKAHYFRGAASTLRDLYLRRWRRAVIKHGLSPVLSEMMSLILRSYSE